MLYKNQHPIITTSTTVQEITTAFLKKHNLSYFQRLKVFADGSFSLLSNRSDWLLFISQVVVKSKQPAVYSYISEKEQLDKQNYWFLWDNNLPEFPVRLAREFNISNGITFVERFADHYIMSAVAVPCNYFNAIDFYLNNINTLKQYFHAFENEQTNLISTIDQHKIFLTPSQQDQNLKKMLFNGNQRTLICFNQINGYITPQEKACLLNLQQGMSYKEIANMFNISSRTVETYLSRVKERFNLTRKRELIQLIRTCQGL